MAKASAATMHDLEYDRCVAIADLRETDDIIAVGAR
jgi:hypothetical protein